jgi:hypothetical protein
MIYLFVGLELEPDRSTSTAPFEPSVLVGYDSLLCGFVARRGLSADCQWRQYVCNVFWLSSPRIVFSLDWLILRLILDAVPVFFPTTLVCRSLLTTRVTRARGTIGSESGCARRSVNAAGGWERSAGRTLLIWLARRRKPARSTWCWHLEVGREAARRREGESVR